MRILIADDEPMVRLGIRTMIQDEAPGQHAITEAANGKEVVARAADYPNLAFVDIRMPLMDGIQAITQAKDVSPETQWVLVTGFSDFEYAQQAIRLGVTDYLLKPVSPEQLMGVINAAQQRLAQQRQAQNRQFQAELMAHFYQMDLLAELPPLASAVGQTLQIFLLCVDCAERDTRALRVRALTERIAQAFEAGEQRYAAFVLPTYDLCLIIQAGETQHARQIVNNLWNARQHPLTILAESVPTYDGLYTTYERLSALSVLRTVCCFDTCCLDWPDDHTTLLESALHTEQIALTFLSRDEFAFRKVVGAFQAAQREGIFAQAHLPSMLAYLRNATGLPLEAGSLPELVASLSANAQKAHRQATGSGDIIEQIKTYVAAHYMQDIAISTLADELDITPNYLSRIFHQRAGCTFISYLSEVRIGIAQQLLAASADVSIREVSEAVGYSNPRHFAKVFTKLTGKSPSAYQGTYSGTPRAASPTMC
ncbi:MAG: response regulator [Clostridia bacterium]|nr:response regulator [Clostridia bacterium]